MKKTILVLLLVLGTYYCMANKKNLAADNANFSISTSFIADTSNSNAQIPIIAWLGVPENQTTVPRYHELQVAGMTHSLSFFSSLQAAQKALDAAQRVKVKLYVFCPELAKDPEGTVKQLMNHPALGGYFIRDEPGMQSFPELAGIVKKIRAIDDKHMCYINLLPNGATPYHMGGTKYYQTYIDLYVSQVPVSMISFDFYPVAGNNYKNIAEHWYSNLETIAAAAKKTNKIFYAFACSVAFGPYPVPTVGALKLQVFSDLAYGAQGIQYFTYWTQADKTTNYNNAAITRQGQKTDVYYRLQEVNKEIKALSGVFLGAKVVSVNHTGPNIPEGTRQLTKLPDAIKTLKTGGNGAVVSVLKNNGNTYLVVVNHDFTNPMDLTIKCAGGVSRVLTDGSSVSQNQDLNTVSVDPGDVAIYKWSN